MTVLIVASAVVVLVLSVAALSAVALATRHDRLVRKLRERGHDGW